MEKEFNLLEGLLAGYKNEKFLDFLFCLYRSIHLVTI
jgi:hypothetical protein